jgi:glutamate carboxypeptidase
MNPKDVLASAETRSEWIRASLRDLVRQESPSEDPAAVNGAVTMVEAHARSLGGRVKRHRQKKFGDILELRFGPARSSRKPILLLGHLDTVWPIGTLKTMPWREEDGRCYGPGVLDMKAGVIMALAAIDILRELKLSRPVTLLLNSDEEVGSDVSRPITEKLASESSAVFVLEPAQGRAYKTARKGVGHYVVQVTGGINRPTMERKPGTIALYKQARKLASELGFDLPEAATGGGSDGNFTAALGIPTLDGMGAIGEGAHAVHEHIVTEHLVPRTALLAALLASAS